MRKLIFILACTLALNACNSHRVSQFPSYKLTIEQGNELDEKTLSQLQPGLSKAQVRSLLGSPLLTDIFHANRWDYVFMVSRNGVIQTQADLTLYFDGDSLSNIEGDALNSNCPEKIQKTEKNRFI